MSNDVVAILLRRLDRLETEIKGEIGGVKGEIGEVNGEIGGIKGEIGGIKGEIGEINRRLDRIEAGQDKILNSVQGLAAFRIEADNRISTLERAVGL